MQFQAISHDFGYFSHFWAYFNMLAIKMHVLEQRNLMWYFQALSSTPSCNFKQFSCNFTQFWLFQPFLGQFQHVEYQNTCTRADKFNGDTFTHFHALPHAISRNFHTISCNFGYCSHFLVNFNMMGIKKHVLKPKSMYSSLEIRWWYFHAISRTSSCNFTQISRNFHTIWTISAIFGQFQHVGYQKAYTWAEKFIGGTGRGRTPSEGAEYPKEESDFLQTEPKSL